MEEEGSSNILAAYNKINANDCDADSDLEIQEPVSKKHLVGLKNESRNVSTANNLHLSLKSMSQ